MPTPKKGARLGGSASHQKHILSNLASNLFEHGAVKTTDAKAKMLRPYAEKLITKAKSGTVADRRAVAAEIPQKDVVAYLFNDLAPKFENRPGGYTRIIKLENRKGDNAPMSQISLVLEEVKPSENRAKRVAAAQAAATEAAPAEAEATEAAPAEAEETPAEAEATEAVEQTAEESGAVEADTEAEAEAEADAAEEAAEDK